MVVLDDRYELRARLGQGGSGVVWDAWDRKTAEPRAVKTLHPQLVATAAACKRFRREADLTSRLTNPHTVKLFSCGETPDGRVYLVMERLSGVTLSTRLHDAGALDPMLAAKIACQILEAVSEAHEQRIVHRDLKPSNVLLVDRDGERDFVKVCDFGLAKAIESDTVREMAGGGVLLETQTTEEGAICGTPEYMAPEQARGEVLDGRADLYAVGVMLFHMVTGVLPFRGSSRLAVVSQHLSVAPPRPSALRPELEIFPPLETLILRVLAKDRAERPSSAAVLRSDLVQIQSDYARRGVARGAVGRSALSDSAATLTTTARPRAARGRRPNPALATVTLLAGAAVVLGLGSYLRRPESGQRPAKQAASSLPVPRAPSTASESALSVSPTTTSAALPAAEPVARDGGERIAIVAKPPKLLRRAPSSSEPDPSPSPAQSETAGRKQGPSAGLEHASELLRQGDISQACEVGRTLTAQDPDSAAAWKFLGQCCMRLGATAEARRSYGKYLELAPHAADAIFVRDMLKEPAP